MMKRVVFFVELALFGFISLGVVGEIVMHNYAWRKNYFYEKSRRNSSEIYNECIRANTNGYARVLEDQAQS